MKTRHLRVPATHTREPVVDGADLRLQTILVPVDFSEESRKAVLYAAAFARTFHASITLLHAVEPVRCPADFGYGPVTMQLPNEVLVRKARTKLKTISKKLLGTRIPTTVLVHSGAAYSRITDAAKDLNADLIIMGTRGQTGLERVMGSTAEKVVRLAICPVMVVRKKEHDFARLTTAKDQNQSAKSIRVAGTPRC